MDVIGYHASHEQFPPSALLEWVALAEQAGFDAAMCSDHLAPWGVRQGESGFSWSWLGAALARTSFSIGSVSSPVQRMHPVVSAQAIATLEEMFPGRGAELRTLFARQEAADLEAGMAKLFATEAALENSLEAMRIHGAYGYSKEFNIERYYRDAPLLAIGEGTNELQRIIIARQLVERNPA